jgi:hypothetical protein
MQMLAYPAEVPYQFMDSWQRLSESEQRELYNKLAQVRAGGRMQGGGDRERISFPPKWLFAVGRVTFQPAI